MAVYAIVRSGSKQQKVAVGDVIEIDKVETGVGETLTLPVVMLVDGDVTSTATGLDKASVTAEVLGATKGPKIIIQKYKNKTGYKKRQGHRQKYTQVKVTGHQPLTAPPEPVTRHEGLNSWHTRRVRPRPRTVGTPTPSVSA